MKKIILAIVMVVVSLSAESTTIGQKIDMLNDKARKTIGLDIDRNKVKPIENKRLLITLSTGDSKKALMAINLANESMKAGAQTVLYVGASAVKYVLNVPHESKDKLLNASRIKMLVFSQVGGIIMVDKKSFNTGDYEKVKLINGSVISDPIDYFDEVMFKSSKNIEF